MIEEKDIKNYLKEQYNFIKKYPFEVGSKMYELEEEFKKYFNAKYASACSSGSSALILSLKALGIKNNDEVMLNINYFISVPNSITIVGAKPIFIDLGENINSLSLNDIIKKKTNKTKAIILIHMYGYPIENTIEIIKYCKKNNIKVIEDCCQSIGAKIGNKYIGGFGNIGLFSFDSHKVVKGGEGGMIIAKNKTIINKINLYKNNYKLNGKYLQLGYNFRYNDFSAMYAKYSLNNINNYMEIRKNTIDKMKIFFQQNNIKENIYKGNSNIVPNFYNVILTPNKNKQFHKKVDLYKINIKDYKNFYSLFKKYRIIKLPHNIFEDKIINFNDLLKYD